MTNRNSYNSDIGAPIQGSASSRDGRASDTAADYVRDNWVWIVVVGVILAVAAALRFWDLGRQSMWFDELFSMQVSSHGPIAAMKITAQDTNPPLYYILQSLFIPLFGRDEIGMRLMPAIFGVLSAGVTYLAGQKLFDRLTGALAAGMFAVSWMAIWFAQEARMYSLLMFFAALVLWLFALLVERPTVTRSILLGVALAALAYTHVYGYVTMPMLLVPVLLVPRLRKRIGTHVAMSYLIAGILFLPWALVIPAQIRLVHSQAAGGSWWIQPPKDIGTALVHDLGVLSPGNDDLPGAIFMILMVAGFAVRPAPAEQPADARPVSANEVRETDILWVVLTLALGPILVGLLVSKYITPISAVRNELVVLPAAYILAARGGLKLWRPVGILALAATVLFAVLQLPGYYTDTTKGSMRQVIDLATADSNTGVLTQDWSSDFKLQMYADGLGRTSLLHAVWVKAPDAGDPPTWVSPDTTDTAGGAAFATRWNRIIVVSQDASSPVAQMVSQLPGYRLMDTPAMDDPYIRMWTKVTP